MTMAYCEEKDLHIGDIPVPEAPQKTLDKWITEGAEEIDSRIGFRYATPVVTDNSPAQRPVALLLKKINSWLASGRFIMAAGTSGADDQLQQQGLYLVTQAQDALSLIVDGTVVLPGVALVGDDDSKTTGPVASFADDGSIVEGFGQTFGYPNQDILNTQRPPSWPPYPYDRVF